MTVIANAVPQVLLVHLALKLPQRIGRLCLSVIKIAALHVKLLGYGMLERLGGLDLLSDLLQQALLVHLLQHLPLLIYLLLPLLNMLPVVLKFDRLLQSLFFPPRRLLVLHSLHVHVLLF